MYKYFVRTCGIVSIVADIEETTIHYTFILFLV